MKHNKSILLLLNVILIFIFSHSIFPHDFQYLLKSKKGRFKDTLFEKIVWHKKVSHIVIEERKYDYLVTLLMIIEYPYNYKSTNYPLHYRFSNIAAAQKKFLWLDNFLKNDGVMRVKILGNNILEENILYKGAKK